MPLSRRTFLAAIGGGCLTACSQAAGQQTPTDVPGPPGPASRVKDRSKLAAANPMGVSQMSFRRLCGEGLTAERLPDLVRSKVGVGRLNWIAGLMGELTVDRVRSIRAACDAAQVRGVLLDPELGPGLAAVDAAGRSAWIERLKPWMERAAALGCVGVGLDIRGTGTWEEQSARVGEGLQSLVPVLKGAGVQGVVRLLGGMSSQGNFVAAAMNRLGDPVVRVEPAWDGWRVDAREEFHRMTGLRLLAPFAACVLADYAAFDDKGDSARFPTEYCMRVIRQTDFRGPVMIQFNGPGDELEGVLKAKAVLSRFKVEP
jgi:hypothetical protein